MNDTKSIYETLEVIGQVLIRCAIMLAIALFLWWGVLALMGDLAFEVHCRFMAIPREQFDLIHYTGMLATKAAMTVLFIFPYVAIRLVIRKNGK